MQRSNKQRKVGALERKLVWFFIRLRVYFFALTELGSLRKMAVAYRYLSELRRQTWAGDLKKMYRVGGKYYFNLYAPGWPSRNYDEIIRSELRRMASPAPAASQLRLIFLAVTRKCPMRCEHCFEWDNLNQRETFTRDQLVQIVDLYQRQGVNQIHFAGGEPLVRLRDLIEVITFAQAKSDCYVVTSGFNLTWENAQALKMAGCKGVIVSIDHYLANRHDHFRHHPGIFDQAVAGVRASRKAGMVTAVSVCATREFVDGDHLLPYLQFAHGLGVHFVQVLEPKDVGNYRGKDVLLEERHIQLLEDQFKLVNHSSKYRDYPTLMYHGYHQRRVGCYSGSRSVYIDSGGDVHACPFCHTKSYNIGVLLRAGNTTLPVKENTCPRYGKIA